MGRQSIETIRRQELTLAAYEVMKRAGLAGLSLAAVAQQAGFSKGMVLHYFTSKEELMERAMRHSNTLLREAVVRRLRLAKSPQQRLAAVIEANFAPRFFRPDITHAWLAFCAEVPFNKQFRRIQTVIHARMNSNLLSGFAPLLPPAGAKAAALGLTTLIDGLWLRHGLQTGGITRQVALQQCYGFVQQALKPQAESPVSRPSSR